MLNLVHRSSRVSSLLEWFTHVRSMVGQVTGFACMQTERPKTPIGMRKKLSKVFQSSTFSGYNVSEFIYNL